MQHFRLWPTNTNHLAQMWVDTTKQCSEISDFPQKHISNPENHVFWTPFSLIITQYLRHWHGFLSFDRRSKICIPAWRENSPLSDALLDVSSTPLMVMQSLTEISRNCLNAWSVNSPTQNLRNLFVCWVSNLWCLFSRSLKLLGWSDVGMCA